MKTTWVLVADEAIARILERPRRAHRDLVPVEELTDPDAHARESDMHNGPHGRRAGAGGGPQATVSASDSARHQHAQVFAKRIAQRLLELRREQRFDALHVYAAPRLLGYLRSELHAEVASTVVETIDKDVVQESNAELTRRVFGPPPRAAA